MPLDKEKLQRQLKAVFDEHRGEPPSKIPSHPHLGPDDTMAILIPELAPEVKEYLDRREIRCDG
jgi:hypothetical protein